MASTLSSLTKQPEIFASTENFLKLSDFMSTRSFLECLRGSVMKMVWLYRYICVNNCFKFHCLYDIFLHRNEAKFKAMFYFGVLA